MISFYICQRLYAKFRQPFAKINHLEYILYKILIKFESQLLILKKIILS